MVRLVPFPSGRRAPLNASISVNLGGRVVDRSFNVVSRIPSQTESGWEVARGQVTRSEAGRAQRLPVGETPTESSRKCVFTF